MASAAPRFGTDGVRARALSELSVEYVYALGRAAAAVLATEVFYVGRDTRESGPALEDALVSGLVGNGAEVRVLGVVPTPAVAHLCAANRAAGVMISASHNPWYDNGVKLFAAGGRKLDDDTQNRIQAVLDELLDGSQLDVSEAERTRVSDASSELAAYENALAESFAGLDLSATALVVDCANGSNHSVAPRVLRRLGANPFVIADEPDGRNINDGCGSTYLNVLAEVVEQRDGAIGIAFDGDADRMLAVDENGDVVDGDRIIALCAKHLRAQGSLRHDTVVVTVMANLGFRLAMTEAGIETIATPVGDRHVLEALDEGGYTLGGEQSGHVIFRETAMTGDGLLTALHLLEVVATQGRPLSELAAEAFSQVPQVLENVVFDVVFDPEDPALVRAVAEAESRLGTRGRVLIRASGTEPLVRIMVESLDEALIDPTLDALRSAVTAQLPG
jgi:phosphoglucosamine mutase